MIFSVNKLLPVSSDVEIEFDSTLGTLFSTETGSIQDDCWSSKQYSSCSVNGGIVTITFEEEISSGTSIEVYFDSAVTLGAAQTHTEKIDITANWLTVELATLDPSGDFDINAAVTNTITPDATPIDMSITSAGEMSDYTFVFEVNAALTSSH